MGLKRTIYLIPIVFVLILSSQFTQNAYADLFARPDGSPSTRWVNGIGPLPCSDLTTHFCVDETVRDDSDYIQTTGLGSGGSDSQFFTLSNIADPLQSTGHILRYTLREGNEGTNPVGFQIILRQGATVIATFTHTQGSLPTTFTLFQQTLTNAQADAITDYSNLELTLIGSCTTGCGNSPSNRERVAVSWVEFVVVTGISPPTLDIINNIDATTLQLQWSPPLDVTGVLSYTIERDSGSGFTIVGSVPVGTNTFTDSGLLTDTVYTYRVISVGATGTSIPSNQITKSTTLVFIESQFARPDSDPGLRWVNGVNCSSLNTFTCVSEEFRSDLNYIETVGLGQNGADNQFYTMSNIRDPFQSIGHILKYTVREANQGTNPVALSVQLRQGAAVIATFSHGAGTLPSTFTTFEQVLTNAQADSITVYNSLELTFTASCSSSCGNSPSEREKIDLSWVEFEIVPLQPLGLTSVDSINGNTLKLNWIAEDLTGVTSINIQRDDGSGFNTISSVSPSTTTFTNSGLSAQNLYKYRLNPVGGGTISPVITGATPPSIATLNLQGASLEPSATNSFSASQRIIFAQTTEHYIIDKVKVRTIIDDITVNRLPAYQIIGKMLDGTYDNSQKMKNLGSFYATKYLGYGNVNTFLNSITQDTVLALGGSNGAGDNPQHGVPKPDPDV